MEAQDSSASIRSEALATEVRTALLVSGLQSTWLLVYVNVSIAMLIGLLQITSDQPLTPAFLGFVARCGASMIASGLLLPLALGGAEWMARNPRLSRAALIGADGIILGVAGLSALPHVSSFGYEQNAQLIVTLGGAAAISAVLVPRVPVALPMGRILLLLPVSLWLIVVQPVAWGLLLGFAAGSFGIAMAIAIWVYRQAHQAADTAARLGEANAESRHLANRLSEALETERANAEKIRREALLRERFVHAVTHDLRQSLSALRLHAESASGNGAPALESLTRVMRDALASADATIESVAQAAWLAESAPPKLSAVPLGPVLQAMATEVQPIMARAEMALRVVAPSVSVQVDPTVLERALRNLIHNAARHAKGRRVLLGARRRGDHVDVVVADDGRGIPLAQQEGVFDRFVQGDTDVPEPGSVGLGLATVKELIERTGGTVSLCSEPGRGTLFALRLPRIEAPVAELTTGRIVVMDDDDVSRATLVKLAEGLGWEAVPCAGPTAVTAVLVSGVQVDAYLFDFFLGERRTALDVLAKFSPEQTRRTLVVSRHIPEAFAVKVAATGASIAAKPLSDAQLAGFLRQIG